MAFKFNKTQSQTNVPRVVMALEMSDNGNVSTLKYVVPRLSRTKGLQVNIMLGGASRGGAVQSYRQ